MRVELEKFVLKQLVGSANTRKYAEANIQKLSKCNIVMADTTAKHKRRINQP